jgi:hypothetical protein
LKPPCACAPPFIGLEVFRVVFASALQFEIFNPVIGLVFVSVM